MKCAFGKNRLMRASVSVCQQQTWEAFAPKTWPTMRELQLGSCKRFATRPAFGTFRDGQLQWTSYAQFETRVEQAKKVLLSDLHVKKGDSVAVISKNSLDWAVCAYATYAAAGAYVPMYENQDAKVRRETRTRVFSSQFL